MKFRYNVMFRRELAGKKINTRNVLLSSQFPMDIEHQDQLRADFMKSAPEGEGWGVATYSRLNFKEQK